MYKNLQLNISRVLD